MIPMLPLGVHKSFFTRQVTVTEEGICDIEEANEMVLILNHVFTM